jgi:N-acetyl-gamma-glutamyl-phosphate reductase
MQRGILATVTGRAFRVAGRYELLDALTAAYVDSPFVEVIDQPPQTRWVVGSNRALVTAYLDDRTDSVIAMCAIDNLLKGAAGQAVQAANLICGLDEGLSLPLAGWMP